MHTTAANSTWISVKGRQIEVPLVQIDGFDIVVTGLWLKFASVRSEEYADKDPSANPGALIAGLKSENTKADIFSFAQRIPDVSVKYPYPMQWDNAAAISLATFDDWWQPLPQATRKNVRRSERRGVVLKIGSLDRKLAEGIKSIYDETPLRQGRRFWHYGKDVETVLKENSTYPEQSDFVAAYFNEELIGLIKMVYVGRTAQIMQIVSKNSHFDKRPANALIARAVELCCQKGLSFLVYGNYIYGHQTDSALIEFKRRTGFQRIDFPRYYVPLTVKGSLAIKMGFHLGLRQRLPRKLESALLALRAKYYQITTGVQKSDIGPTEPERKEELATEAAK